MAQEYGDLFAHEPKLEHLRSEEERVYGDGVVIVSREDLIEAGEITFDHDRAEWGILVLGSIGFPRPTLGVLVIRLTDEGELVTTIE